MSAEAEQPPTGDPRPPAPVGVDDPRIEALCLLIGIVDRLREPDGCPWDREQTERSMAPHLLEETYELLEAIESEDATAEAEEAGDVLMNVLIICRIAQESGRYDLARSAGAIADKLVRRHPHVFGDAQAADAQEVLVRWEAIKKSERKSGGEDASALAGIPKNLPALQRAARTCGKAVSAGFRWKDVGGALAKLREELQELEEVLPPAVLRADAGPEFSDEQRARAEHELGDVLLAAAYLGQYLGLDPESAARAAIRRFEQRFRTMEGKLGGTVANHELDAQMTAWEAAKRASP
jgi:MazG family protein